MSSRVGTCLSCVLFFYCMVFEKPTYPSDLSLIQRFPKFLVHGAISSTKITSSKKNVPWSKVETVTWAAGLLDTEQTSRIVLIRNLNLGLCSRHFDIQFGNHEFQCCFFSETGPHMFRQGQISLLCALRALHHIYQFVILLSFITFISL